MSVQNVTVTEDVTATLYQELGLNEREADAAQTAAHAALARSNFLAYNTFIDQSYETPPHIQLLCEYLQALEEGYIRRLIVLMPPQHGKSETASGKFPGWCIGRDPTRRAIITSYGATLAQTFSIQNRDTISSNPHWGLVFPEVTISPTVHAADKWAVTGRRESCIAGGVDGPITGFGAWLLAIDDPHKNYTEASSPTGTASTYKWYQTTSRTRLHQDGRLLIIMTHWTEIDLYGRIKDSPEYKDFEVLHLTAESYGAPEDYSDEKEHKSFPVTAFPDPLGRPPGDVLWEERYNKKFLASARMVMQEEYEALYQGNPGTPGGTKFKGGLFRPIVQAQLDELDVQTVLKVRSWDLAWSEKQAADHSCGLRATLYYKYPVDKDPPPGKKRLEDVGLPDMMLVLEDLVRYKKDWDKIPDDILKAAQNDTPAYEIVVEAVASQNIGFKSMRKSPKLWKHIISPHVPNKDKYARAQLTMRLNALGLLFVLYPNASTPPEWEEAFLEELETFPHSGRKDDQVDALTQIVNHKQSIIDTLLWEIDPERVITPFSEELLSSELLRHQRKLPYPFTEGSSVAMRDQLAWLN